MLKWIEEIWTPSIEGCRMLMLDSLWVHKMESVKQAQSAYGRERDALIQEQDTVEIYISNGTGTMIFLEAQAWDMVDKKAIISGFIKANHIPKGHRDANGKFRTYLLSPPENAVVPE
ncbi:hypothetical protein F442_07064 [Phytophthora nicotianae P10297]|uniref:DDE-1 domain-containing protein n=2 Tax=Phytophthora nicotianae TaxID=4792 RepID=W2ZHL1_PHYNI|nr:hypothetical protein F444_11412 [Phytophthora nicotianae P1976]ETP46768.1 hypothetical protein F442_07064 [Phytophthora nicotianae P10297]